MTQSRLLLLGDSNFMFTPSERSRLFRLLDCSLPGYVWGGWPDTSVAALVDAQLPGQVVRVPCRTLRLSRDIVNILHSVFSVLHDRPLVVLVALGQNDVHDYTSETRVHFDLSHLRQALVQRALKVLDLCDAHPHVLLRFVAPFNDEPVHFTQQYLEGSKILDEVIRSTGAYVDLGVCGPFVDDHYHLDDSGRQQMATAICSWLSDLNVEEALGARTRNITSRFQKWLGQCAWCA